MYLDDQGATALLPPRNIEILLDPEKPPEPADAGSAPVVAEMGERDILTELARVPNPKESRDATLVAEMVGHLIEIRRVRRAARVIITQ